MPVLAEARKMARASEDDPVVIADLDEWDWPVLPTSELWTG